PIVNYLPFTSGPAAGGAPIYIVGNYLAGTSVTINGAPIQVTTQSQYFISGTTPPGTVGTATVLLQSPTGCATTTQYTYN
ncbi:MAG TPA: cell surface receptor IPT/TIG domain-containing protein, partial [bacterium]|nr:cell surface receptor IPT/TIG domain-containing protein [bacterium]